VSAGLLPRRGGARRGDRGGLSNNFTCAECTRDDYCFNNSLFNCSDERMRSAPGSDEAADCRCADGFYNSADDTLCVACEEDHYCVDGARLACAPERWTQGLTRQSECACRPGLRALAGGARNGACAPCGAGFFCVDDDGAQACRAHSATPHQQATAFHDCECLPGSAMPAARRARARRARPRARSRQASATRRAATARGARALTGSSQACGAAR